MRPSLSSGAHPTPAGLQDGSSTPRNVPTRTALPPPAGIVISHGRWPWLSEDEAAREGDLRAVGRPGRMLVVGAAARQPPQSASVGVDHVELAVRRAVRGGGHARAVARRRTRRTRAACRRATRRARRLRTSPRLRTFAPFASARKSVGLDRRRARRLEARERRSSSRRATRPARGRCRRASSGAGRRPPAVAVKSEIVGATTDSTTPRERDPLPVGRERWHRVERPWSIAGAIRAAARPPSSAGSGRCPSRAGCARRRGAGRRATRRGPSRRRGLSCRRDGHPPQAGAVRPHRVEARRSTLARQSSPKAIRPLAGAPVALPAKPARKTAAAAASMTLTPRAYAPIGRVCCRPACGKIPCNARERALRLRLRRAVRGRTGAPRRQGRRPGRDDAARRPGPGRLHDHDRRLPRLHGERPAAAGRARRGDRRASRRARAADRQALRRLRTTRCSSRSAPAPRSRCPG